MNYIQKNKTKKKHTTQIQANNTISSNKEQLHSFRLKAEKTFFFNFLFSPMQLIPKYTLIFLKLLFKKQST